MLSKLACAAFALAALVAPQSGIWDRQDFTDCDLDIRPENRQEVQVYWTEAPSAQKGVELTFWARTDDVLALGFPDGDPAKEIWLKAGVANTATFIYDPATNVTTLETNNGTDRMLYEIPTTGQYKALYPLLTPTKTLVRKPANNKERFMVTGKNFDLEFPCTLTRTIP